MNIRYYFLCVLAILFIFLPVYWPQYTSNTLQNTAVLTHKKQPHVTIWVHGTRLTPHVFFNAFFDAPLGLSAIANLPENYQHRYIAQALCEVDPACFEFKHFYLFGWSGSLSIQARKKAAKDLIIALQQLLATYQQQDMYPLVHIITHSHGGNVVLHMTEEEMAITIDKLTLLACPVQHETKNYIQHPMFNNIVSIYSAWDALQILAPQIPQLFSDRTFPLQPNLAQVEIWHNKRGPMHIEFLLCDNLSGFIRLLPNILATTKQHFSTQFLSTEVKPVQKLVITTNQTLVWEKA